MSAPFRLNIRVFQMMALILTAMAVPLVLVILGVRQISFKAPAGPAPEVPGLRQSLELAADKALSRPAALGENRRVLMPAKDRSAAELRSLVQREAAALGGTVVEIPSEKDSRAGSLLVQVPGPSADALERTLGPWLDQSSSSGETGGGLIEIRLVQP